MRVARGSALRLPVTGSRATCCFGAGGLGAPRELFSHSPAAGPASAGALERGMKERAGQEGGSAAARAHWKLQCWSWIRRLDDEAEAGRKGGRGNDSRRERNGNQRAGCCCDPAARCSGGPSCRVWSWSQCWKSKRRRGARLPSGPEAKTSAAPWSWETSLARSTLSRNTLN